MFYPALSKGPFKVPGVHDAQSVRPFGITLRPDAWVTATVYYCTALAASRVIASVFTGIYFVALTPGVSGATEPVWNYTMGGTTVDGVTGLTWQTVAYDLMIPEESIATATITVSPTAPVLTLDPLTYGPDPVTVSSVTNTAVGITFVIDALADTTLTKFDVTCHYVKNTGQTDDITLRFKVANR